MSLASAAVTCVLLLFNGALVIATIDNLPRETPDWVRKPEFTQFMLFLMPVAMVVIEWIFLDYIMNLFRSRRA